MTTPERLEAGPARAVADAVAALPGVAGLHSGHVGEIALLFPRERVAGLRERAGRLEIHVRVIVDPSGDGDGAASSRLRTRADGIRAAAVSALGPDAEGRAVDVIIADAVSPERAAAERAAAERDDATDHAHT